MKKKYVRPTIIVRNVNLKHYFLGSSFVKPSQACESWVGNMDGVLGGTTDADGHGSFHNKDFEVNSEIWGNTTSGL